MGIAPTERLRLRRQMAAAVKKELVSSSLFMEMNHLEVEEDLSTMEAEVDEHMEKGAAEGLEKAVFFLKVQTWRQVRGPSGDDMCETHDLGIKWPLWHILLFEGQVAVDRRVVF